MKLTIYLPDDLGARVQAADDLNVSAVCQEALRAQLHQREGLAALRDQMERIVLFDAERGQDVSFIGISLVYDVRYNRTAYLTARERIAVYDPDRQHLTSYDDFEDFAEAYSDTPDLVGDVAHAFGRTDYAIPLDI